MDGTEILKAFQLLGKTQGFYARLFQKLSDGSKESEDFLRDLEDKRFENIVDLILYYEQDDSIQKKS